MASINEKSNLVINAKNEQCIDSIQTSLKNENFKVWLAACVKMYHEKKTSILLNNLGIENFLPIQIEHHKWSDRIKKIERLVLPMVIFVKVDKEQRRNVLNLSTIYKYVSNPCEHAPAIIPDKEMDRFKFMLDYSEHCVEFTQSPIREGVRIRVIKGPLNGLEGLLINISSKTKVAVKLDILGYACVDMPISYVMSLE